MSPWRLFWRELRLVLRLRWARWLLCASISLSVLGSVVLWGSVARASHALLVHCSDEEGRAYLDKLVGCVCVCARVRVTRGVLRCYRVPCSAVTT